jgi:hypothetical protein
MQDPPSPQCRQEWRRLRPRLSLRARKVCKLAFALAIAALRSASDYWVATMFSMTLGLLMTAVRGVWYRRGTRRAFWLEFSLFGWVYWLLSFGPWFSCPTGGIDEVAVLSRPSGQADLEPR